MAKTTRVKKQVKPAKSQEEIEIVISEYATADAKYKKIIATIEQTITALREKHEDELIDLKTTIQEKVEDLQTYATANPDLFKDKKSVDLVHGSIGFRTGTHKLQTLRKLKWDDVLPLIKKKLPTYVRVKEELAKDKLIADRDDKKVSKYFDYCGIEVVQDETFFVELKKEGAE